VERDDIIEEIKYLFIVHAPVTAIQQKVFGCFLSHSITL